jgi:hypothetical protein
LPPFDLDTALRSPSHPRHQKNNDSRSPTQVASHAQKHFIRLARQGSASSSKRSSRFAAVEHEVRTKKEKRRKLYPPNHLALFVVGVEALK